MITKAIEKLQSDAYLKTTHSVEIVKGKYHKANWFKKIIRYLHRL